jgi:hypothetical protein
MSFDVVILMMTARTVLMVKIAKVVSHRTRQAESPLNNSLPLPVEMGSPVPAHDELDTAE